MSTFVVGKGILIARCSCGLEIRGLEYIHYMNSHYQTLNHQWEEVPDVIIVENLKPRRKKIAKANRSR